MISIDYLIIGGGIAGTVAAETVRAHDMAASIAIVEREAHALYSRVLLPQYIMHKISRADLFLRTSEHYVAHNIGLYPNAVVISVDVSRNEAYVALDGDPARPQETFSYKKLLIASGGHPSPMPETFDLGPAIKILRMHTLADADTIKNTIENASAKDALVLGEGFIAMEFMQIFSASGSKVHILCSNGSFGEKRFGAPGARMLEAYYEHRGMRFYKNIKDAELKHKDAWFTEHNRPVSVSFAGVGVGITRNIAAYVGIDKNIGITTDEYLRTSAENVWAAGDVAEYYDTISGEHRTVGNWNNAFMQGHVAALNTLGVKTAFKNVPAYTIINFDLNITLLGDVERYDEAIEDIGNVVDLYMERILIKQGKISGAVLINRFNEKTRLSALIARGASAEYAQNKLYKRS